MRRMEDEGPGVPTSGPFVEANDRHQPTPAPPVAQAEDAPDELASGWAGWIGDP